MQGVTDIELAVAKEQHRVIKAEMMVSRELFPGRFDFPRGRFGPYGDGTEIYDAPLTATQKEKRINRRQQLKRQLARRGERAQASRESAPATPAASHTSLPTAVFPSGE